MRTGRRIGLALCGIVVLLTTAAAGASAACPNEAIREAQGSTFLPACMGVEMLSPPKKFGQETGQLSAFSADGTRALYRSKAALAETEGLQTFAGDNYVGILEAAGWTTFPTSPPRSAEIQAGGTSFGGPYAFSSDLGGWALFGATQSQQYPGELQFFRDGLQEPFRPLSPLLKPINDSGTTIQTEVANLTPSGTAADLSATVWSTEFDSTAFFPEDPRNSGGGGGNNSYIAYFDENGAPTVELLARDGAGTVYGGRCGSRVGNGNLNQGAISVDGSRIYFSTRPDQPSSEGLEGPPCDTDNPLRIMVREEGPGGSEITELISGGPTEGDDLYQGASLDGSKIFLATPRNLTTSDQDASSEACGADIGSSKGCDLYLYDASLPEAERLIQVSAGGTGDPDPGKGANVLPSTIALSPDGTHAYFVAQGVLTTDLNPAGQGAVANKPNLYLYVRDAAHPTGAISFIGTLAEADKVDLWGRGLSFSNGAYAVPMMDGSEGGDGDVLFLTSEAPLVPSEDTDASFADIFRYDADAVPPTLACITCSTELPEDDAVGGSNAGLDAPPSSNFAQQGRWASEDGETMVFASGQPLVPGDEDEDLNPYLWKEGVLTRLPGDVDPSQIFQRPIVSQGGEVVGFSTTAPLLPQDGDTARDVYLARVNGGFLPTPPPLICNPLIEGSCQGPPSQPSSTTAAATDAFVGAGNVKAPPKCKKGFVRKGGKCVKKNKGKKKKGKQGSKNRAAAKSQGGSK